MKIAQVCPYDIDRPGGVQQHILDTSDAMRELGHDVTIIAPNMGKSGLNHSRAGPEIIRIGRARKIGFGETSYEISVALGKDRLALRTLMRERGFDVVHYHTIWTPFLALQAFFYSQDPAIATFHDTTANTPAGRMLRLLFRLLSRILLPRFGAVTTPSEAPKEHLIAGETRPVIVVPPCTNLSRFYSPAAPEERYQDGLTNILFVGRLEPRKGAILLLKAYEALKGEGLPVRLIIAGGGDEERGLRDYAKQHALRDVEFIGFFPSCDAAKLYATADIFCAPSPHGESFGIVVAEAMASGKPVVAAANAGYRSLLTGPAADFLVPPGDVNGLRDSLRQLILNPALRESLGAWGRQQALQYDCRRWAPRILDLYRSVVVSRSGPKARIAS